MKKEKSALLIQADGAEQTVKPKDGKKFSLKELQGYVGGLVQFVPLPDGRTLVCNDEGKLIGLPVNNVATDLWKKLYPIEKYPIGNDSLVVGDVLVGKGF